MIDVPYPRRLSVGRLVFALLLAAHGTVHFIAVARTVRSVGLDLPLELFGGSLVTSSRAVPMLVAPALGAAGTGFLAAAFMVVGREPKVGPLLMAVATLSLVATVVGLWGTAGGALVNLAVLAAVSGAPRLVDTQEPKASEAIRTAAMPVTDPPRPRR